MSPKELLYIEDTLGHEKQLKDLCCDAGNRLQDAELKNFVQDVTAKLTANFNKIYGLL